MNRPAKGIRELNEGEQVERVFLVRAKQGLVTKNGNPYVSLKLADRTGEIDAKIWDRADDLSARFKKDDFVRVRGSSHRSRALRRSLSGTSIRFRPTRLRSRNSCPPRSVPLDEMAAAFRQIADSVSNPHIRALILSFADDDAFMNGLKRAPAAKGMHHVYIGGLIEHILDLVGLARDVVPHFPWVDGDLVVAGCVFHDVGKVAELKYERSFDYSTEGHLLGHIAIGYEWVTERIRGIPGFPDDLAMRIKHLILAHHGELAFGSPEGPDDARGLRRPSSRQPVREARQRPGVPRSRPGGGKRERNDPVPQDSRPVSLQGSRSKRRVDWERWWERGPMNLPNLVTVTRIILIPVFIILLVYGPVAWALAAFSSPA